MDRIDTFRAFVRLVELGTFSAVADESGVGQPTVSKWIAALEEELGGQLVERTTRQLRVTETGRQFYERAKEVLGAYEDATAVVLAQSPELRGRLRVSLPVVFGRLFIVPLLPRFLRRHRQLELEVVFQDRYVNLIEDAIDVAVRVGAPRDSTFRAKQLAVTPRRLVASPGYIARHGRPRRPADLSGHECLVHSGLRGGDPWMFTRRGRTTRVMATGRFSANNSEAVLGMARGGLGIALLASWLVDKEIDRGRLEVLLPNDEPPPAPIRAVMPPGRYVHPRVRAFLGFLEAELALGESARAAQ